MLRKPPGNMCLRLGADHDKPGPIAGNFEDRRIGIYGLPSIGWSPILRGSIVDDLDSKPRGLTALTTSRYGD